MGVRPHPWTTLNALHGCGLSIRGNMYVRYHRCGPSVTGRWGITSLVDALVAVGFVVAVLVASDVILPSGLLINGRLNHVPLGVDQLQLFVTS